MKTLYFEVPNIDTILTMYDQIDVIRYIGSLAEPGAPIGEVETLPNWVTVSGVAPYTSPISLTVNNTYYYVYDDLGSDSDWYASRYSDSSDPANVSGWSSPVLSSTQGVYYNPIYPAEIETTGADQLVVNRLRTLIGDPVELKRDNGENYEVNLHPDGKVYELSEKGWPVSITVGGQQYNTITNPTVNGYKYLKFNSDVSDFTTISGVSYNIDIWYYTFRHSDKELLSTYDRTPPPFGLTSITATSEAYVLASAIDLVRSELLLDSTESGSKFSDDLTTYDPKPGLDVKLKLLDDLKSQLDKVVTSLKLAGISGVLID